MTLTLELSPDLEAKLEAEAKKRGIQLPDLALSALERLVDSQPKPEEETAAESILRIAANIHASAPPDAWEGLPPDLAKHYKHYLYGHPKEEE